ncbi:MAG: cadherin repeat domain-containing protein, partial [Paracoccus hibiscisoli]|uniref:cadherin repeat domain-containing protein n=1 Tax=Paracoccus hibiscisoli TaxID=2023261 RepID=UPI00391AB175
MTINILDVNEVPVMPDYEREVPENSPVGTLVGAPVTGTDPDFGQTLTFAVVAGNSEGVFAIAPSTGQLRVARAVLDYETRNEYVLTVSVTDNGEPQLSASATVTIRVLEVNRPPTLADTTRRVDELSPVGTPVGAVLRGVDLDPGQVLSFRVTGGNCWAARAEGESKQYQVLPLPLAEQ